MRKFKILSMILIALASSVVFVACSCAPKRNISPQEIRISAAPSEIYVGDTFDIDVEVRPENATSVTVSVKSNHSGIAKVSKESISGVNGKITITGVGEGTTNIEFTIKHTSVNKKVHTVNVIKREPLNAPENVQFNETTNELRFVGVENAENYELHITNNSTNEVVVAEAEHELSDDGFVLIELLGSGLITPQTEYSIKVRALGHGKKYTTSEYSENAVSIIKLQTPQNIRFENNMVMWDLNAIDGVSYKYILNNDSEVVVEENDFIRLAADPKEIYSYKIIAVHETNENIYASDWSDIFEVYKLSNELNGRLKNKNLVSDETLHSIFEFDEVEGALSYNILVLNKNNDKVFEKSISNTDRRELSIDDRFEDGKEYTLQVVAKGNGNNILDSVNYKFDFTKHHAPKDFNFENGKITFAHNNQSNKTEYEIIVVDENYAQQVFSTTNLEDGKTTYDLLEKIETEGSYNIFVRAISQTNNFANSNKINTNQIFHKLSKPKVIAIKNNSELEFTKIDNATGYHFYVNGVRHDEINYREHEQDDSLLVADLLSITNNLVAGSYHTLAIAALNQGQSSSTIAESTIADAGEFFEFYKLQSPTQGYQIVGDTILWDEVEEAQSYNIIENNSQTVVNRQPASYTMQNVQENNNQITVVAVGNNKNIINSQEFTFKIAGQQLSKPQNIRVENGEFKFDFRQDENYEIFVENEFNELEKVALIDENHNLNIANFLQTNKNIKVGVRAVPKSGAGKLGSAMTVITLHKLQTPENVAVSRQALDENDLNALLDENDLNALNNYYLKFAANSNVSENELNYKIVATHINEENNFTQVIPTNNLLISDDLNNLESGVYNITIVANGNTLQNFENENSVGYLNSEISEIYQVVKLNAVSNIVFEDGVITFIEPTNANNVAHFGFMVKITNNDESETFYKKFTNSSEIDISEVEIPSDAFRVFVKVIANEIGSVNSDYAEMETGTIKTLSKVENVRVENGKIAWNEQTESPRQTLYDVYVQLQNDEDIILVAGNLTNTEFEIETEMPANQQHKVYVVAKSSGFYKSPLSNELVVNKLPTVSGFGISKQEQGYVLVWDLLLNETETEIASRYEVVMINGNTKTTIGVADAGVNSLPLTDLNLTDAGSHNLRIKAIGGVINQNNYISSDFSQDLNVVVLASVASLRVENGMVKWEHSYTTEDFDKPINYKLTISQNNEDFVNIEEILNPNETEFVLPESPESLEAGQYSVSVISVGENNKISSTPRTIQVIKADPNTLNLRSESGVITWDAYKDRTHSVSYEIYISSGDFENESSFEFVGETTSNSFVIPENKITENDLHQVRIKVVPVGELSSVLSTPLQVVKLPQVQNFAINKGQNNNPHFFSWEQVATNSEFGNYEFAVGGYRVVPQFSTDWSEGFANKNQASLPFSFPEADEYEFAIKAIGNNATAEENEIAFLNSEQSQTITLVVLDAVENVFVENGQLVINHSPLYSNNETAPQSILVVVEGDNEFYKEIVLPFSQGNGQTFWNFKDENNELLASGAYNVKVFAVSSHNNIVNSHENVLTNIVVLNAPSNLNSLNGKFSLDGSETQNLAVEYEIYLNNEAITMLPLENIKEVSHLDLIGNEAKLIKVRAVAENAIYSNFSETVNISKLETVKGITIENQNDNPVLRWQNVSSNEPNENDRFAENVYRIYFNPLTDDIAQALFENPNFNEDFGYLEVATSGEFGWNMPANLPSGDYELYMIAVGGEKENSNGKSLYLNSQNSTYLNFSVVGKVVGISADKGIVRWYETPKAVQYKIEIYSGFNVDEQAEPQLALIQTGLEINLNNLALNSGAYTARVFALGNEAKNISGGEYEEIKFNKGDTLNNFVVQDGYLSWQINESVIKHYATGDRNFAGSLTSEDFELVAGLILNNSGVVNASLLNNLQPIINPVFAVKKQGQSNYINYTFDVHSAIVANRTITVKFNFNLPEGEYEVRAMLQGNKMLTEVAESQTEENSLSILTGENALTNVMHINSNTTQNMKVFKLPAPISPIANAPFAIKNNKLTFSLITVANETWANYVVIAKQQTTGEIIEHKVQNINTAESVSVHDVDVRDINSLNPSITYQLSVVAVGTAYGTVNADLNYLTSRYTTQNQIVILAPPTTLGVTNGKISFAKVEGSANHTLRIWNDGQSYENSSSHDLGHGIVKLELNINEIYDDLNNDHNEFLEFIDGVYYYNLENNPYVPANADNGNIHRNNRRYYVSATSEGDGTRTISSKNNRTIDVVKWGTVEISDQDNKIVIEEGKFKWAHVTALNPGDSAGQYKPQAYKVVVVRETIKITKTEIDGEQVDNVDTIDVEYYDAVIHETLGMADQTYVFYELPDSEEFAAMPENAGEGFQYKYRVLVSAYGHSETENLHFATGNTNLLANSVSGTRLATPTGITTESGVVFWNYVPSAGSYSFEISIADTIVQRDVGNTIFADLSVREFNPGVFMFSVKAYGAQSAHYLNSRSSEQVKMQKLPTPALRIVNGEIKWNNSQENLSQEYAELIIRGPVGFDIYALESMQDIAQENILEMPDGSYKVIVNNNSLINTMHELSLKGSPVGTYEIEVQYIGSTGLVQQENDEFFTTNSNVINLETTKLQSPSKDGELGIVVKSNEVNGNTFTYVEWSAVENATNYNVVAIKLPEGAVWIDDNNLLAYNKHDIMNKAVFTYSNNAQGYFSVENGEFKFDLRAVVDYDNNSQISEELKFGFDYYVYVEAFADNRQAVAGQTILAHSISDDSNLQTVKVPLTPTNLAVSTYGLITWTNRTIEAKPVLRIRYQVDGVEKEDIIDWLMVGDTSYQLSLINPAYSIEIRSEIILSDAGTQSSAYSEVVMGGFNSYESGEGTVQNPYIITSADQLYRVNYHINKHFKLANDINLDSSSYNLINGWNPIGQTVRDGFKIGAFSGVLDGADHTITNINYNNTILGRLAFIDTVSQGAVVKNLTLEINASNINVGSFGGVAVTNNGTIENVVTIGNVTSQQTNDHHGGRHYLGGIVAENNGTISLAINKLNITSATSGVQEVLIGGVAYQNTGTITKSANHGDIEGMGIGGVVYINEGSLESVYNTGGFTVVVNADYTYTVNVGGLIGTNEEGATLSNSYALFENPVQITNNTNSSTKIYAGGLIGANGGPSGNSAGAGLVSNSYAVFRAERAGGSTINISLGGITGTGNSNNYENVYYLGVAGDGLQPVSGDDSGIPEKLKNTSRNETVMKNQPFVEMLGITKFRISTDGGYPQLIWQ